MSQVHWNYCISGSYVSASEKNNCVHRHGFSFSSSFLVSLIHSIATRVIKLAHTKSSVALAPALVETYSRLLVYMEIESLGIKGFISKTNFAAVSND